MKTLFLLGVLLPAQDPTWHCPTCKKDVPADEVKAAPCREPHGDIIHKKNCAVPRHTACRTEVERKGPAPLASEPCGDLGMNAAASFLADGDEGLMKRFEAARDGKTAAELSAKEDLVAVAILGPSGNGADPLRAAKARFSWDAEKRIVHVVVTKVEWEKGPQVGTQDFTVIGFRAKVGRIAAGEVKLIVWEETAKSAAPNAPVKETTKPKKVAESAFTIK